METIIPTPEERGVDGLEPDQMLPGQFFGALKSQAGTSGERRLMAAVLQEGIETLQKTLHTTDPEGREAFCDALAWLRAKHDADLFSFTTVCAVLDIDADWLRDGLMRRLEERRAEGKRPAAQAQPTPTVETPEFEPLRHCG
ncbi:MAG: hypothetical protein ACKPBU_12090 [Alphaproteobacteria bacterium]